MRQRLFIIFGILVILLTSCVGPTPKQLKQAEIHYDLGVNDIKAGKFTQALKNFLDACRLNPKFGEAQAGLGLVYYMLGQHEKALAHYHEALKLRPKDSSLLNNMARVYISQNKYRVAIPLLEKALEDVFLKERYLAESNLGWALFNTGKIKEGFKYVRNALAQNSNYCVGYEYLGLMYQTNKELENSIVEFKQLTQLCPAYLPGYFLLGKVLLMKGNELEGCKNLQACWEQSRMSEVGHECGRLLKLSCQKVKPITK
jgi:Tfp pilus assembly protein PilF